MKRAIKNSIYAVVIIGILFVAALAWDRPVASKFAATEGNTTLEKMHALARVLTAENEGFVDVFFVDYDDKIKGWIFTVHVKHPIKDIYGTSSDAPNPLLRKYSLVMEGIFTETSRLAPDKEGAIKVLAQFSDSKAEEWSTKSMALIAENPQEWLRFVSQQDILQMPRSDFAEAMRSFQESNSR